MGVVGKLLSFVRATRRGAKVSDSKVDPGGGQVLTGEHFGPSGDDSHPLPGDYAHVIKLKSGQVVTVGYVDPKNTQKAQPGEKRIYSRDSGGEVAEVTLKADGSILGQNGSGSFNLTAAGDFVINGVRITANGEVIVPTSLTLAGKEIAGHTHPIISGDSAPGPTGPNT